MFRAAVLSIVLTLAIGQNATLLCLVWCHPEEVETSTCQQHSAPASRWVIGEDSCRTAPAAATTAVREEAKRESLSASAHWAALAGAFAPSLTDGGLRHHPGIALGAERSPLLIPLRL